MAVLTGGGGGHDLRADPEFFFGQSNFEFYVFLKYYEKTDNYKVIFE